MEQSHLIETPILMEVPVYKTPDFKNTGVAFSMYSDRALRKAYWLFRLMNSTTLVSIFSQLALFGLKWRIPGMEWMIRKTIFSQFVGGRTLAETKTTVDRLEKVHVLTVLDFGAEAKQSEEEFDHTMRELLKAIQWSDEDKSIPVVSMKITGLARYALLEKFQSGMSLSPEELREWERCKIRLHTLAQAAKNSGTVLFIDAEESWIQISIDTLVTELMEEYNREKVIIYNTYQLYRKDHLDWLKKAHERARDKHYFLGAKLVRGAYMKKEAEHAEELGIASCIQNSKEDTDKDYNAAIAYCIEHYQDIASCNASHNEASAMYQAQLIHELGIPKNHPHCNFCQLYGMSDQITLNLASLGYNAAKYVPYGSVQDVIPYLIRRAQENASVTGDMSRELKQIDKEMKRRKLDS